MRVLGERFELVSPLGAGAMGAVYRARDLTQGQDVALKVLPELDATALLRFKNEFRALHDVEHPNLVRLHELHEDRGMWFFTMQLIDGVDVLTWVRDDVSRLRVVLPQLAQALQRLHDEGLVHRDVKPENILVTPAGRAMLLDFGLVAPTWSPGEGVGTPSYMAPEQLAGDISPAADWYAVGTLIFRACTGRFPFVGAAEDVMRAKAERAAPRVRDLQPSAPADLAALADALLARNPRDRPSPSAILGALGVDGARHGSARNVLVGRERELAILRDAVVERAAPAVEVTGESGLGKTSLLRAFCDELQLSGDVFVLNGRCWERESVPYKGFDGVIDELAARLEADHVVLDDAGWNGLLVQAFPVLRRAPGFTARQSYAEIVGRETAARVSTALRWLLTEVAKLQPLVIVIDDLHWADRDTFALVRDLLEPPLPNVLFVLGSRERVLSGIRATTIELSPLSHAETAEVVEIVVRELGGSVDVAAIAREAAGHPLFAAELARHVVETGEMAATSFEDVIVRLAARFGETCKQVATILSLAHSPLSVEATAQAANLTGPAVFDAITRLRGAQLIATTGIGKETRLEPYHDRIRRALVHGLRDTTELHGRIARALEATAVDDPAALALHWEQAGEPKTAAHHALRAAERAESALAFHRAARFYTWALALDSTLPIRVRQAESLAQAMLGVDAAEAFLACAKEASSAEAIDLQRRAMQQLLLMGHDERALTMLDELLATLRIPNPKKPVRIVARLLRSRAWIRLHRPVLPPPATQDPPLAERVKLDVLWDAAAGLALVDPLRSFYFHSLNLELCLRGKDGSRLARAVLGEAPYLAASGKETARLRRCLEVADQAAARTSFPALTTLARGSSAFLFGRWRECFANLSTCERLLQQDRPRLVKEGFGPAQLQDLTRRLRLAAMFYLGDLRELRSRVAEQLRDAIERNDVTSATHLRTGIQTSMFLAFGDVAEATRNADEGIRPWRQSRIGIPHFMDAQARTVIALYKGENAYEPLLASWGKLARSGVMRAQYVKITLLDARGRAALAAGELRDAKRCIRGLRATRAPWAMAMSCALEAGVAVAEGNERTIELLERTSALFETADMPLHARIARLVRAEVAHDDTAVAAETAALSAIGVADVARYSRLMLPRS